MQLFITLTLVSVGFIHIAPSIGMLGGGWLASLYGLEFADPNLQILMRHRAVMFGILGLFMLYSVFNRDFQVAALLIAIVSTLSFELLIWQVGDYNQQLFKLAMIDLAALLAAVVALALVVYRA